MMEEVTRTNWKQFEALENFMTELSTMITKIVRLQGKTNESLDCLLASKGKELVGGR